MGIPDFEPFDFEDAGIRHQVFCRGEGPAVVLMHDLPGMTEACVQLAERIAERGFRVYMPLLFGKAGERATVRNSLRVCIRREFRIFAARRSSPVVDWLRALSRRAFADCGGPGVGAIGMCLTGNFALGLMLDEHLLAAPSERSPSPPASSRASSSGPSRERGCSGCASAKTRSVPRSASPGCGKRSARRSRPSRSTRRRAIPTGSRAWRTPSSPTTSSTAKATRPARRSSACSSFWKRTSRTDGERGLGELAEA